MYKSPPLNLVKAAQLGDLRARDRVLMASTDFISYIARDRSSHYKCLEYDDCVQAGYLGVVNAIRSFDFSKGTQFFTHAKYQIHNSILKLIRTEDSQSRTCEKAVQQYEIPASEPLSCLAQIQTNRSLRRRIYAILKNFPKQVRKWVVLKLLGTSYVKIAQRFQVSRHLVSDQVKEALAILRQRLLPQVKRLSIKRLPGVNIKSGQVTRHKPIPIATVFERLRSLCTNLVQSSQTAVQRLPPFPVIAFQFPSRKPKVCPQKFWGQGLGIPPPAPE